MTRLLLIAHAATAWNAEGRYQGWSDVPLSDAGRDQAGRIANALRGRSFDAIISSDLSRAVETAASCGGKVFDLPIPGVVRSASRKTCRHILDARLREMNFGAWEGKTASAIDDVPPEWIRGDIEARPPGGESLADFACRIDAFLAELPTGDVAIVGHRGSLRILLCRLLGLPALSHWSFRFDLASISEVDFSSGRAVLIRLNDRHHLDEGEARHG